MGPRRIMETIRLKTIDEASKIIMEYIYNDESLSFFYQCGMLMLEVDKNNKINFIVDKKKYESIAAGGPVPQPVKFPTLKWNLNIDKNI